MNARELIERAATWRAWPEGGTSDDDLQADCKAWLERERAEAKAKAEGMPEPPSTVAASWELLQNAIGKLDELEHLPAAEVAPALRELLRSLVTGAFGLGFRSAKPGGREQLAELPDVTPAATMAEASQRYEPFAKDLALAFDASCVFVLVVGGKIGTGAARCERVRKESELPPLHELEVRCLRSLLEHIEAELVGEHQIIGQCRGEQGGEQGGERGGPMAAAGVGAKTDHGEGTTEGNAG